MYYFICYFRTSQSWIKLGLFLHYYTFLKQVFFENIFGSYNEMVSLLQQFATFNEKLHWYVTTTNIINFKSPFLWFTYWFLNSFNKIFLVYKSLHLINYKIIKQILPRTERPEGSWGRRLQVRCFLLKQNKIALMTETE